VIAGIRRDTDDTQDDGALMATNVRYYIEGETRRRLGMDLFDATGAQRITQFTNPATGDFAILITPTGNMEAILI
jgi:hypothetical protein